MLYTWIIVPQGSGGGFQILKNSAASELKLYLVVLCFPQWKFILGFNLNLVINPQGFLDSFGLENYFVFPSNLRHLRIGGCFLTKEMTANIARLKKLESLTLRGEISLGGNKVPLLGRHKCGVPCTQILYTL
ncbi:hypothetical protein RDI58_015824 [Solanum bulbocastanum]|uniref:Uncharacterized protein n=1 Tax=Solanum bulbocastanum TaxID=147425 RepID=A0AAN8YBX3_SOLBU